MRKVIRGASWINWAMSAMSAYRTWASLEEAGDSFGFRVLRRRMKCGK